MGLLSSKVIIAPKVKYRIKDSVVNSKDEFEVGGVLLGKKIGNLFVITTATLPKGSHYQSSFSFELSDDDIFQAYSYMKRKAFSLSFLGFWHSHTLGLNKLSSTDKKSISTVASIYGETIALLVTVQDNNSIVIDIFSSQSLEHCFKRVLL